MNTTGHNGDILERSQGLVCMVRSDGSRVVYILNVKKAPADPITELIRIDATENFVRGFFLDEIADRKTIEEITLSWDSYNRSLQGIWYSPHFEEIYRNAQSSSAFRFYGENWIEARYKYDVPEVIDMTDIEEMIRNEVRGGE